MESSKESIFAHDSQYANHSTESQPKKQLDANISRPPHHFDSNFDQHRTIHNSKLSTPYPDPFQRAIKGLLQPFRAIQQLRAMAADQSQGFRGPLEPQPLYPDPASTCPCGVSHEGSEPQGKEQEIYAIPAHSMPITYPLL